MSNPVGLAPLAVVRCEASQLVSGVGVVSYAHSVVLNTKPEMVSPKGPMDAEARNATIDELLKMASSFGSQALEMLLNQEGDGGPARGHAVDYASMIFQLEVHFLFPNLQEADRHLLVGLGMARAGVLAGLRNTGNPGGAGDQPQQDANLLEIKHRFVTLRAEVMARGLVARMNSIQEALLEREFLTLPRAQPAGMPPPM